MRKRNRIRNRPTIADMAKAYGSVDAMLARLADGWIHEIQGNPVFRAIENGQWYDIPEAFDGWIALWERIDEHYNLQLDLEPMRVLSARLRYGSPIPPELVARCQTLVDSTKRHYRRMNVYDIGSLVKTTRIQIHADALGLTQQEIA